MGVNQARNKRSKATVVKTVSLNAKAGHFDQKPIASVTAASKKMGATAAAVLAASPPVPASKSEKSCGIADLIVTCKHGRRPGSLRVLQVVADGTHTDTRLLDDEKSFLSALQLEGKRTCAGSDPVIATVVSVDGKESGRKQLAMNLTGAYPRDEEWVSRGKETFKVEAAPWMDRFPINAGPVKHYIHGRGCDDTTQMVIVESFPNQNYEVSIGLKFFADWVTKVNEGWEKWGEKFFGLTPVSLKPEIKEPKGTFKASWGWKEESDWRAYFEIAVHIGLDPIFGISIEVEISALKMIGCAFGIPPVLAEFGSEHLADILLSGSAGVEASIMGGPTGKFYATGEEKLLGEAKLSGTGFAEVKLTARVGSKFVYQASWCGSGRIEIRPEGRMALKREGLFWSSKGELDPLTLGFKVETTTFFFFTKSKKDTWKVWDTLTLWETSEHRLLPS